MNATDTLNRVKAVLGLEVSLERMKMENGTVIEAEKFEEGAPVFIVTEDEKVALPKGEYELEGEKMLIVIEEGIISEIKDIEEAEEEEKEEEMEEEKKEMEYVSKEEFSTALEEIKAMIESLKKEEMSEVEETEETPSEELSEEVIEETTEAEELKAELSKPATEPLKHSPEKEAVKGGFQFSKNRQMTTLDRVMQKITNF